MKLGIINSAFQKAGVDTVDGLKHIARIGFDTRDVFTASDPKALNHTYAGTEDLLLGLLRETDDLASRVPKKFGLDMEGTRL